MAHRRRAEGPLVAAVVLGDSTARIVSLRGLGARLAWLRARRRFDAMGGSLPSAAGLRALLAKRPT